MPIDPPEPPALHRLYRTKRAEGLPALLRQLYPRTIPSRLYLGTAGSCRNGGAGLFYRPRDWEADYVVTMGLDIHWGAPTGAKQPSPRTNPTTAARTAIYRLRDQTGRLLYVGISDDPLRRWPEHAKDKPWWPEVANFSTEWLASRPEALAAEASAIKLEKPLYNVVHNSPVLTTQ